MNIDWEARARAAESVLALHRAALEGTDEEVRRLREALRQILGWREMRETMAFPVERVEEIARSALASTLTVEVEPGDMVDAPTAGEWCDCVACGGGDPEDTEGCIHQPTVSADGKGESNG